MTDRTLFARGHAMHALGKCTEELKTQVPEQLKNELTALAVLRNQTPSEYLRELIVSHLYGHLEAVRMAHGERKGNGGNRAD